MPPRANRTTRTAQRQVFKKAEVGRLLGGEMKKIPFKEGDTIEVLLSHANITLHKGEEVNDENGNTMDIKTPATETSYYITGNYKNGSQ